MHEWLHKIGFEHSYYNNSDRPYTVPYAIGEIVEVKLPRPRDRVSLAQDAQYGAYRTAVLEFLYRKQAHPAREAA